MITSVSMKREISGLKFHQRTKDGYFDANELMLAWNRKNTRRRIDDFMNSKGTTEFVEILNDELANGEKSPMAFYQIKGKNTFKGKSANQLWMHPYLFIKFSMWINPKFELKVIKFVYDELIKQRIDAGDNYKVLSSAGTKLQGYSYPEVAHPNAK